MTAKKKDTGPELPYSGADVEWLEKLEYGNHGYAVLLDDGSLEPKVMPIPSPFEIENPNMSLEARLYFAAFIACPKDLGRLDATQKEVYFDREPPAKRVARAVERELKAIRKGVKPPTKELLAIAVCLAR
jgi:hypothetical protein